MAPSVSSSGGTPDPSGAGLAIVHTDDAATNLSDRVRRRCFNCCTTTDTITWRRSNLSPGKVLCNKCGLFERAHSRPRPEQFPHKRAPVAASTLRGSGDVPQQHQPQTQTHYQPYPPPQASSSTFGQYQRGQYAPYPPRLSAPPSVQQPQDHTTSTSNSNSNQ
ncbi:hypothetical protein B0H16DRAFT_1428324, partial [Mycena metata]